MYLLSIYHGYGHPTAQMLIQSTVSILQRSSLLYHDQYCRPPIIEQVVLQRCIRLCAWVCENSCHWPLLV